MAGQESAEYDQPAQRRHRSQRRNRPRIGRGSAACHTVAGNGCHAANSRINTRLARNT
jgi:hypothetical protein